MELAQDRVQWQALVLAVLNLRVLLQTCSSSNTNLVLSCLCLYWRCAPSAEPQPQTSTCLNRWLLLSPLKCVCMLASWYRLPVFAEALYQCPCKCGMMWHLMHHVLSVTVAVLHLT
jgi:hypothetical protein